jgi:hypothetical protein
LAVGLANAFIQHPLWSVFGMNITIDVAANSHHDESEQCACSDAQHAFAVLPCVTSSACQGAAPHQPALHSLKAACILF